MTSEPSVQQLTVYAAAAATCADRYAKVFYPMTRNADEKMVCCVHGGEDMDHYLRAAEVLRAHGVDLTGLVERPISERGLRGADALEAATTWAGRAVFSALFERALLTQLKALAASSDPEIARMAGSAVACEEKHVAHGMALLRQECSSAEAHKAAQHAIQQIWPTALAVLDSDSARAEFVEAARADLAPLGLSVAVQD